MEMEITKKMVEDFLYKFTNNYNDFDKPIDMRTPKFISFWNKRFNCKMDATEIIILVEKLWG